MNHCSSESCLQIRMVLSLEKISIFVCLKPMWDRCVTGKKFYIT